MQPQPARQPLSLDDVAHLVERHCGMTPQDAHDLLEDILTEVGHLLQDIDAARQTPPLHVPPERALEIPGVLPYAEDWDPDFDPRKSMLLMPLDGHPSREPDKDK